MNSKIRKSPPPPLSPIAFDLPRPEEHRLDNGLRVIVFRDERLPLVSYRLAFLSGDISDPADQKGLTSAMATLATEGTRNYTSAQLAEKVERLGAGISASSSDDFTVFAASSLSLYGSEVLALLAEAALQPVFPEDEIELYKRNTIENLKFQRSQPGFLASERSAEIIYGDHPYGRLAPTPADIERLGRATLARFHSRTIVPDNALLIVAGDVDGDGFLEEVSEHFGDWQPGTPAAESFPSVAATGRRVAVVDRPGSSQSNILISNLAIERRNADYFPLLVMNQVLGAGASSRVFMNLREEKGYTYGAYTRLNTKRLAGDLEATAEVRNEVTGDALKEFFYEFERIRKEPVLEDEIRDAESFLAGVFPIRAETQEGRTTLIVNQYLYDLPTDYLETYRENILAVDRDAVMAAAEKYVRPDEMSIVIVGDASNVVPQVESYADTVEIFNAEGQRKQ